MTNDERAIAWLNDHPELVDAIFTSYYDAPPSQFSEGFAKDRLWIHARRAAVTVLTWPVGGVTFLDQLEARYEQVGTARPGGVGNTEWYLSGDLRHDISERWAPVFRKLPSP